MPSNIYCTKVTNSVIDSVKKTLEISNYKKYIKEPIFLKVNLLSDQVVPGQCTSPYVLEGVLQKLKQDGYKEIYCGDANVATSNQVERAAKKWNHLEICEKYNVKFINLSKQDKIKINSKIFGNIGIPEILKKVNSIITLPVLKTHNVSKFTCALKNQWGCLPEVRHQYHLILDKCIPEINNILKPNFVLVDATVCMEGSGPRTGKPRIMNAIFASNDLVSMDSFCSDLIGVGEVDYVLNAEKIGLGSSKYNLLGDKIEKTKFEPALISNHPIVFLEMKLRKIPVLSWFLFKTPFFKIPAFFASKYNSFFWYYTKGKKYAGTIIKESKIYNEEFKELI